MDHFMKNSCKIIYICIYIYIYIYVYIQEDGGASASTSSLTNRHSIHFDSLEHALSGKLVSLLPVLYYLKSAPIGTCKCNFQPLIKKLWKFVCRSTDQPNDRPTYRQFRTIHMYICPPGSKKCSFNLMSLCPGLETLDLPVRKKTWPADNSKPQV